MFLSRQSSKTSRLFGPWWFKFIYTTHNYLRSEAFKASKFVAFSITVIGVIIIYQKTQNPFTTGLLSALTFLAFVLLYFILGFLIQKHIGNTGIKEKFIFPGKYLVRKEYGEPCELNLDLTYTNKFKFAVDDLAPIVADLNMRGYARGRWATNLEDKLQRNRAHILKNKYSILLIKSASENKYLGYTHVFPVSKRTWERYLRGEIKDNKFGANLIVADNHAGKKDAAFGLILFSVVSVGIDRDYSGLPKNYRSYIGELLEQAVVYHIKTHMDCSFNDDERDVPVLLQNMSDSYLDFFKACTSNTKNISGDGARIIAFEVVKS